MGYPVMIYVNDDLKEQLKSVKNKSGLICKLLKEHFSFSNLSEAELIEQKRVLQIQIDAMEKIHNGRTI